MAGADDLRSFGTATLLEAWPQARLVDRPIRPLAAGMAVAGPAFPVTCKAGDNLALHLAIAAARPGDVLVVDYGDSLDSGPFGEIMALACQMRGIAGLITNGAVRDSRQIIELGFAVFAAGLNIRGTTKTDRGRVGEPVRIGGVSISAGDIVVADDDAIIAIDSTDLAAACTAAKARTDKETAMMDRLRAGETTLTILGLEGTRP